MNDANNIDELRALVRDCIDLTKATLDYHRQRMDDIEALLLKAIDQNQTILKDADSRLDRANAMVLNLTESINGMKEMCSYISGRYVEHIAQACKSRDIAQEENVKMRGELEELHREMFTTLKELARRPTISNTNKTQEQ